MASASYTTAGRDAKRAKVEDEERDRGWDILGQYEYYVYWGPDPNKPEGEPELLEVDPGDYIDYFKNVRAGKGYDVTARRPQRTIGFVWPCPCPPPSVGFELILPPDCSPEDEANAFDFEKFPGYSRQSRLAHLFARVAVDFHNKKTGAQLDFVSLVKAYRCVSLTFYFYITLVAKDKSDRFKKCLTRVSHHRGGMPNNYSYTVESFLIAGDTDELPKPTPKSELPTGVELVHLKTPLVRYGLPS